METTKINTYLLVFSEGDSLEVEAETLLIAFSKASEKYNVGDLARVSINGGPYKKIVCENCDCGAFGTIPCKKALREAEQKAA